MELPPEKRAELVNYISDARAAKKKDKEIKKTLVEAGWPEDVVTPVLIQTKPKAKVSPVTIFVILLAIVSFSITGFLIWVAIK